MLVKTSLALPADLVSSIDKICASLGISRSVLLTALLEQPVADICLLLEMNPVVSDRPILRNRGKSSQVIRDRLALLKAAANANSQD